MKQLDVRIYWRATDPLLTPEAQSAAARALLQTALERDYEIKGPVELITDAPGKKPYLKNSKLQTSITHTAGLVACAVSNVPVGIDAQAGRPIKEGLPKRVMSPQELSGYDRRESTFFRLWTHKESALKQLGLGLAGGMRSVVFDPYSFKCLSHPQFSFFYTVQNGIHLSVCAPQGSAFSLFSV